MSRLEFFWRDWLICEITRAARDYEKNTKGAEEERNCYLKFKSKRDFVQNEPNYFKQRSFLSHYYKAQSQWTEKSTNHGKENASKRIVIIIQTPDHLKKNM